MKLSALTSSLPMNLPDAIASIADLGFDWIDTPPTTDLAACQALQDRGLRVACVALEREQPPEVDLTSDDVDVRKRSLDYFQQALVNTAKLDAPVAYLTPPVPADETTLARWTESLIALADCAQAEGINLCVEHFPQRALPTVAATLEFLDGIGHDALAILIDVGHCLISREDPAESVIASGGRLGYIHFDDNDATDDLHWSLLDGRLTESQVQAVISALRDSPYDGPLCIELNPELDQPVENLRRSRDVLRRFLSGQCNA